MATRTKGAVEKVESVQVEGLVAVKIIKHCQEEGSSTEVINGFLVGLVVGETLEITNCFPLPKSLSSPDDEMEYQVQLLANLRKVNADYHQVGWYQSTFLNTHLTRELLENHVPYQTTIEESVVLVYEPLRTAQGNLTLKAYQLSEKVLGMLKRGDQFTPESVQKAGMMYSDMFVELPVVLHNSHLVNALLAELDLLTPSAPPCNILDLSALHELEKHMQLLMESVDGLQQETYKLLGYERNLAKQQQIKQQFTQKRREENLRREGNNEKLLPMDDESIEKDLNLKPVHPPCRKDALLSAGHVASRSQDITGIAGETFAKLYMTEALQK